MPTDAPPDAEVVRLLLQALEEHGYARAAGMLQEESGIVLEAPSVGEFRRAILEGAYEAALSLLPKFASDEAALGRISFLVERERYLELLQEKRVKDALGQLRDCVTPNAADPAEVQTLAGLIMLTPPEIQRRLNWDGPGTASREDLLRRIQRCLPTSVMLEPRRLERLVEQAIRYQISCCPAHFAGHSTGGVLFDHQCSSGAYCLALRTTLREHTDEIWHCAISNGGAYVATASKDHIVNIWSLPGGKLVTTLKEHAAGVMHVAWSPDDKSVLTCSLDSRARLWDVESGVCTRIFLLNGEASAGVWTSAGTAVVVASQDGSLTRFSRDGTDSHCRALRCTDLCGLDNGRIAALDHQNNVHFLRTGDLATDGSFWAGEARTCSLAASRTGTSFLVNEMALGMTSLYTLTEGSYALADSFTGHHNERYVIRSCFAREDEGLVVAGSEDGYLFVYHRETGRMVQKVQAHDGIVNCVKWTDFHGGLLISAGDDRTVKIWSR